MKKLLNRTGNRMSEEVGGGEPVAYRYAADSHRLQEVGTHRYGYDANGNLVEGLVRGVGGTLEVGAHNRPRGWRLPNGSGQWRHNTRGERVWVEARGGMGGVPLLRERIVHDESGRRLETRRLQPDSVQSLIWLDQLPVAVVQDGVVHAIEADHLGTPRLATHLDTGEVSWRWDFFGSAFGGHAAENRGLDLALRFPGQYHDPATGLHYNYFRDYDPTTGRYIESDPIGLAGGINTYGYALQNPLVMFDPDGLKVWRCRRPLCGLTENCQPGNSSPPVVNHQYLCVTRFDGSIECGGQTSDKAGFWPSPGRPTTPDEDWYDEKTCREVDDDRDRCTEACVIEEFTKPRPSYGIGPQGTDCQEWADDVLTRCKAMCYFRGGGYSGPPRRRK